MGFINLDKKVFKAIVNSQSGEVSQNTLFYYAQNDNIISAKYSGGKILQGSLLGKQLPSGEFDFVYQHINTDEELKIGKCLSTAVILENGKIKLFEQWQWLCDDMSSGESELVEIKL